MRILPIDGNFQAQKRNKINTIDIRHAHQSATTDAHELWPSPRKKRRNELFASVCVSVGSFSYSFSYHSVDTDHSILCFHKAKLLRAANEIISFTHYYFDKKKVNKTIVFSLSLFIWLWILCFRIYSRFFLNNSFVKKESKLHKK